MIADIIVNSLDLRFVVVSATYNSTNELEEIANAATKSTCHSKDLIASFLFKHESLARELEVLNFCQASFEQFKLEAINYCDQIHESLEVSSELMDALYSLGERFSSVILYSFLKEKLHHEVEHLDARNVITTNTRFRDATPLFGIIERNLTNLDKTKVYITQGFIGKTIDGRTTTLGREGSDYTASILAWAIKATRLIIWKDVGGILSWDPKIHDGAYKLSEISYDEATLLTEAGAKVLFHRTMNPLKERSIPLEVKGVYAPTEHGSVISNKPHGKILGLVETKKQDYSLLSICGNKLISNASINQLIETEINNLHEYNDNLATFKINSQRRDSLLEKIVQIVTHSFDS
ncbi:amino acid kinase family protein [Bacteriovorax sp. Seq25_V]|nr:amino acid kinase family protein [Bacteriovorax sp. Seq25_V]